MRRKRVMLLISILVIAGAGITGYVMARDEPRLRDEPEASAAAAAGADNVRISDNATVRWEYDYEMCGHTVVVEDVADKTVAGLTFTQLQQKFPDARIVDFDQNKVVLSRRFACYCPEHYMLKKYGEELAILRTQSGSDEQSVFRSIHVGFSTFKKRDQDVLAAGRVFDSLQDTEAYLYDILEARTQ